MRMSLQHLPTHSSSSSHGARDFMHAYVTAALDAGVGSDEMYSPPEWQRCWARDGPFWWGFYDQRPMFTKLCGVPIGRGNHAR